MVEAKGVEEKPEKEVTEEGGSYWEFDDQFEDFEDRRNTAEEAAAATEAAKEETLPLWEADWNDEGLGEDFIAKLKREQQKLAK
jgi:hypothetical protein